MNRRTMGMVAGMLVFTLAGCAEDSTAPAAAPVDAQRAQLVVRTQDLAASVRTSGRLSDQDRVTLTALARDVDKWQELNGGSTSEAGSGGLRQLSISRPGNTGGTCSGVCVPVVVLGDVICFITGYTCIGTQKRCLYDCFVNLDVLPVKRV